MSFFMFYTNTHISELILKKKKIIRTNWRFFKTNTQRLNMSFYNDLDSSIQIQKRKTLYDDKNNQLYLFVNFKIHFVTFWDLSIFPLLTFFLSNTWQIFIQQIKMKMIQGVAIKVWTEQPVPHPVLNHRIA